MSKLTIYEKLRENINTGDLLAFEGFDHGAKLIKKYAGGPITHVGIAIRIPDLDRVFILEAVPLRGVILMALSTRLKTCTDKAWWLPLGNSKTRITEQMRFDIYRSTLLDSLGKNYDYENILNQTKKSFDLLAKLPFENYSSFICSEVVALAYKVVGLFPKNKSVSMVTPQEVRNLPIYGSGCSLF